MTGTGETASDLALIKDFEATLQKGHHWRHEKQVDAYFPVAEYLAVVLATFPSASTSPTRDRFERGLLRVCENARAKYESSHEHSTGLLNQGAFDDRLREAIQRAQAAEHPGRADDAVIGARTRVAVLAFDVDHFKQVNDTYGRPYGDVVLQCLALRAESVITAFESSGEPRRAVTLARMQGEEFLVLVEGAVGKADVEALAQALRRAVDRGPLPSETEWELPPVAEKARALELPPDYDRHVTISVGAAFAVPGGKGGEVANSVEQVKRRADAPALHRAKSGGRDCVCHFDDIAQKHGVVVEHHAETGVVAIDLGLSANVAVGQEFLVYHPDFTGQRPFVRSDGHTEREFGMYPRRPCGRIVVFDAQPEMSFCIVAPGDVEVQRFAVGSALELVPLGAIAHLLKGSVVGTGADGPTPTPADELPTTVKRIVEREQRPVAAVVVLDDVDALLQRRGSVFVNRALATLYGVLREVFGFDATVSQVAPMQFAVLVVGPTAADVGKQLETVLATAKLRCGGGAVFKAGICDPGSVKTPVELPDKTVLQPEHALEYARYAVENGKADAVQEFTHETGYEIMLRAARRERWGEVLADYAKLRELGVQYAFLENQAALAAYYVGAEKKETALAAIERAVALSPDSAILSCNRGVIEYAFGSRERALESFRKAVATQKLPAAYQPIYALLGM